jgi:hypothetical protein
MMTSLKTYCHLASALVLAMLSCLLGNAMAADVRTVISGTGSYRDLIIEGVIEPGDFDKFIKAIRDNQGLIPGVTLFSPGGDFNEAMKIGRAMRALELSSTVPIRDPYGKPSCEIDYLQLKDPQNCTCGSACFFIHIGAVGRYGTFLAVHRPYFNQTQFGKLTEAQARKEFESLQNRARDYMQEMGVPKHIQEDVLGTPSDHALILDEKTVKTYFLFELPYRHEWLMAKCSRLSDEERVRWDGYLRKLTSGSGHLSRSEESDYQSLQQKHDEETHCEISLNKQSRIAAYEKYFGVKPTDYANHNFSRWAEAPKYLGRRFEDILDEERFDKKEDKLPDWTFTSLERPATATTPLTQLFESASPPQVVTQIDLYSPPSPSREFIQRLTKTLEDAWGKPIGGNGSTEWIWSKARFKAELKYSPVSADGPHFTLEVKAKP